MILFDIRFFTALGVLLAVSMNPVCVKAESLTEAVSSALKNHPQVEGARAGLEAAIESEAEQFSGYFPEIALSGTAGRIFGDNSTSRGLTVTRGSTYSYLGEGSATVRQQIFDGFETANRIDSAHARREAAGMELVSVQEDLALRASQSYVNVLRVRKALAMLKMQAKKVDDYLARIKNAVDEGVADDTEYQRALDVQLVLDGIISDYEGQTRAADAEYWGLTGHLPEGELVEPILRQDLLPETADLAVETAKSDHPSLRAAMLVAESASYDISAEKAGFYPDFDGELSYLKSDKSDLIGGELTDARAVVRMNWSFETGGAQKARIKRKTYEHQETIARWHDMQKQVEHQVRLAYAEYETAMKQKDNQEKRYKLNIEMLKTYKVQFEGARVRLLDLMQADNQLFNTELEKLNGQYRALSAQYAIFASMGRLQDTLKLAALEPVKP